MITVHFMLEGSSEFIVPMPELPRTGEKVAVENTVYQIANVCWEIHDGQCSSALVIGEYSSFSLAHMPYQDYLSSRHWRRVRAAALVRAVYACQLCNNRQATLDVHHRTYERRGHERPEDLIVLCRACHTKFHRDVGETKGEIVT